MKLQWLYIAMYSFVFCFLPGCKCSDDKASEVKDSSNSADQYSEEVDEVPPGDDDKNDQLLYEEDDTSSDTGTKESGESESDDY